MSIKPNLLLVQKSLLIRRPIAAVFEFLSNHENYPQWFPAVLSVDSANDLAHGVVGKLYNETLSLLGGRRTFVIKVVDSQTPHTFATEGNLAPLHPRMEMSLSPVSEQETLLKLAFLSRSQTFLGRLLAATLVKRLVTRQTEQGLVQLKNRLEA